MCYQRAYITWLPNTRKHPVSSCTFKSIYCWILFAFTLLRICVYVWINVFLSFFLFLLLGLILPLKMNWLGISIFWKSWKKLCILKLFSWVWSYRLLLEIFELCHFLNSYRVSKIFHIRWVMIILLEEIAHWLILPVKCVCVLAFSYNQFDICRFYGDSPYSIYF